MTSTNSPTHFLWLHYLSVHEVYELVRDKIGGAVPVVHGLEHVFYILQLLFRLFLLLL